MSDSQNTIDKMFSFTLADKHTDIVSDLPLTSENTIETDLASNQDPPSKHADSVQEVNLKALKKKFFTPLSVVNGKQYYFCKNVLINQCKDPRHCNKKGCYSLLTGGSIFRKHVEICFGIIFDGNNTAPKKDIKQTTILTKRHHDEHLALTLIDNMVC